MVTLQRLYTSTCLIALLLLGYCTFATIRPAASPSVVVALGDGDAMWRVAADERSPDSVPTALRPSSARHSADRTDLKRRVQALLKSFEERATVDFLIDNMPAQDVGALSEEYLSDNIRLAVKAWRGAPWHEAVPWRMFLNYIAPYAVVDEPRDPWRPIFSNLVDTLLVGVREPEEAVEALNRRLWGLWQPAIRFVPDQAPATLSPFQVIAARNASCSGLSIFLVDALRAAGLPARMAGVPEWNTPAGGNHNWVEVWIAGDWHFLGASEPDPRGLDHAWFFPQPVSRAIPGGGLRSVFATSWEPTPDGLHFPLYYDLSKRWVHAYDVTSRYVGAQPTST